MSAVTKVTVQDTYSVVVQESVGSVTLEQLEENVVPVVLTQQSVSKVVPTQEEVIVTVAAIQGPAGPSCTIEDSKTLTYEDGLLSEVQTATGTKTFVYDTNQVLVGIVGAGQYPNKTFTYDTNGLLIAVDAE